MRPCKSEPIMTKIMPAAAAPHNQAAMVLGPIADYHYPEQHVNGSKLSNGHSVASSYCEELDLNEEANHLKFYTGAAWASSTHSLDSFDSYMNEHVFTQEQELITDMLTIEELRNAYNSCLSCGVNWHDNHVSLDCGECDGYGMSRPCPDCDGKCGSVWERNVRKSHTNQRASWEGSCLRSCMSSAVESLSLAFDKSASLAIGGNKSPHLIPPLKP